MDKFELIIKKFEDYLREKGSEQIQKELKEIQEKYPDLNKGPTVQEFLDSFIIRKL